MIAKATKQGIRKFIGVVLKIIIILITKTTGNIFCPFVFIYHLLRKAGRQASKQP